MSDTILVAVLGCIGTIIGSISGILIANKLVNWRLQRLEEKVDKHNRLIERMTVAENDIKHLYKCVQARDN